MANELKISSQGRVPFDWAFIMDVLAIMECKSAKLENGKKRDEVLKGIENLWNEIEKQLGFNLLLVIYQSQEYQELLKVNEEIWDAVELAEQDKISGKIVADMNNRRHVCKQKLQSKFFNSPLTEQKARS